MSTPNSKPTRQQLEELDALLQRMLSLPTNQLESEMTGRFAAPAEAMAPQPPMMPPPSAYSAPPAMARQPMPSMPAPPMRRAEPPRGENAWQVPLPPASGGIGVWPASVDQSQAGVPLSNPRMPAPSMPASRLNVATIPSPDEANRSRDMRPIIAMPAPLPGAQTQPLPFYLWPFGLVDQSMGGTLAAFGLPGRWLGQGSGKILIGWAGLLMLGGAAAWGIMDYLGLSW
jgi:hypothetical protein